MPLPRLDSHQRSPPPERLPFLVASLLEPTPMLMLELRPQLEPELGLMPPPMPTLPPMPEPALELGLALQLMLMLVPKLELLLIIMLKPEPAVAIELPHRLALRLALAAPTMVASPPALPVQLVVEQQRRQQLLELEPGPLVAHLVPPLGLRLRQRLARLVARRRRKAFDLSAITITILSSNH